MAVHLVKMAVGLEDVGALRAIQARRIRPGKRGARAVVCHRTRFRPRRAEEIVDGGSIYWVIRGYIQARQRVHEIVSVIGNDGALRCELRLDPVLVKTEPRPMRPFQGWRYLHPASSPADLTLGGSDAEPPPAMAAELRRLGLL